MTVYCTKEEGEEGGGGGQNRSTHVQYTLVHFSNPAGNVERGIFIISVKFDLSTNSTHLGVNCHEESAVMLANNSLLNQLRLIIIPTGNSPVQSALSLIILSKYDKRRKKKL